MHERPRYLRGCKTLGRWDEHQHMGRLLWELDASAISHWPASQGCAALRDMWGRLYWSGMEFSS